jgi:hypothetical protein
MRPIFSPRRFRAYELYYTPGEYGATSDNRFVYHPGNILSAPEWIASNPAPEKPVADESVEPVERLEWDGKLSRNAVWKPAEKCRRQITDYLEMRENRFNGLYELACSLMMSAVHAGYDLSKEELADILLQLQRANPPSNQCYTDHEIYNNTHPKVVRWAKEKVLRPVFLERERVIEQEMKEIENAIQEESENES